MPLLSDFATGTAWVEPDDVPRPVVTYGFKGDVGAIELEPHTHAKGQVLLVQHGALSCEVEGGLWMVPPRSALWIPGGAMHAIKIAGALEGYGAFIRPTVEPRLPGTCCAISVTTLLRELLIRSAALPLFYEEGGAISRMVVVLLDELASATVEDLHLPMPTDPRLRRIIDPMIASPTHRQPLEAWAEQAGLSARTLERLMSRQTGMSFGRWRQQLAVILAVKWMAGGASIQQVAADLGYENAASFVTMFRKALGTSPGRYMAERHSGRS